MITGIHRKGVISLEEFTNANQTYYSLLVFSLIETRISILIKLGLLV